MKRNWVFPLLIAILFSSLSAGLLYEPKAEPTTTENNKPTIDLPPLDIANKTISPALFHNPHEQSIRSILPQIATTTTIENTEPTPEFMVTTDYGYSCSTGDPEQAIEDAIDSLPEPRLAPCNIYLQGQFYPISHISMANNINFIGKNATIISESRKPIFSHNWGENSSETFGNGFEVDGKFYQDWITLHNVTFQSIHFKQLNSSSSQGNSAIYFYDGNSTGWGISENINVYDSEFEGFYNCIQGLSVNSTYKGNHFYNYTNNAMMLPFGANLTIQNNIFDTPSNELTVEQYQKRSGRISIQGGIGLFLMDVFDEAYISDNTFIEGTNSTGIIFSSSTGNFVVTGNSFFGDGSPIAIDIFPRPWLTSGVKFFSNNGAEDFNYDNGIFWGNENSISNN